MNHDDGYIVANIFRSVALFTGFVFGILVFLFALVSGSEAYGGGLMGMVKNSPNALPWALLLLLVGVAWKWEFLGGSLILALAAYLFYLLKIFTLFSLAPFVIVLIVLFDGLFFIISWALKR
jgi:hypothetical protein